MNESFKKLIGKDSLRAYIMIAVLGIIWLYFHWATDSIFLTSRNLSNLVTQMAVTAILAVGMLMVIVSGNIDLSVGSVLGFTGGLSAYLLMNAGYGLPAAILAAIVVAVLIGLLHGALTAYLNIPAFIVTLGGLLAWRGAVKWLLAGNTIQISDDTFKIIGQGNLTPIVGWVMAGLCIVAVIIMSLRKARSGRRIRIDDGKLCRLGRSRGSSDNSDRSLYLGDEFVSGRAGSGSDITRRCPDRIISNKLDDIRPIPLRDRRQS